MPPGFTLKKRLNRLKVSTGRVKEAVNGRANVKRHSHKYESDDRDSDDEQFKRGRGRESISNSGIKGKKPWLGWERNEEEVIDRKRKKSDAMGKVGKGRKSLGVRADGKSLPMAGKYSPEHVLATIKGKSRLTKKGINSEKRRDFDDGHLDQEEGSARVIRARRGQSWKNDANPGSRDAGGGKCRRTDVRAPAENLRLKGGKNVEASSVNVRLKGKQITGSLSTDKLNDGAMNHILENVGENKGRSDQIAEQKPRRLQTRVLDKSGKKKRINRKAAEDGSAEANAPPKKKKRVIKLDPYDLSNKRLDDTVSENDIVVEKKIEMSKNAQFRAIQPSPSILSFVEDNLLGCRRLNELQNAGYNIKLPVPLDNIPFSTSTMRERIEENVFRSKLEFFAAAKISSSFPPPTIPEIAFAGRSNVGKSSLLNALTRQWGVVRTSDKPGHTQTINFFRLASKLCLVDLPGYGFAYAKEEVKEAWQELVKEYVSTRVGLQRVCLLIDTKWGMKPRDHELIDLMERSQTPYQIVLTKTDVVFPIDVARRAMQVQENLKKNKSIVNPVMMVSSKSGAGIRNLRAMLAKLVQYIKP